MRSFFQSHTAEPPPPVLVPTVFPQIEGAEIAAVFSPHRVAGDFYDAIRVSPQRVLFGLLDVAGRRENTRGILTVAQEIFRTAGQELFSPTDLNEADAMAQFCVRINRRLIDHCCGVHPCPAFVGCYHEKLGTLCYTNAGHTAGLYRDATGVTELASTGLPLGLFSHSTCEAPIVAIEKGASLLLVSRGVLECNGQRDRSADEFGLDRVKQLLEAAPLTSAQALCASVLNSVDEFTGKSPRCDDRTALALLRTK